MAYEPKKQEWDEFCTFVFGKPAIANAGDNVTTVQQLPVQVLAQLYTVTPNSCYLYLFYQSHRKKRPSNRPATDTIFGEEEYAEYKMINEKYGGAQANPPDPSNCLGHSQVNVYRGAVYNIFLEQKAAGCNNYSWEDINNAALKQLMKKIRNRAPMIAKRNAEEKIDAAMAPFLYIQWLPRLEKYFFSKGISNFRSAVFASLRNGFTFKFTLCGVIRGESLEKADLSNLCDYFWKGKSDPYHIHLLIMSMLQGKMNKDKKLFSRAMRHREVPMCALGGLVLYL